MHRRQVAAGLAAALFTAGCGSNRPPPSPARPVPVQPGRTAFADAKPVDWTGAGPAALPVHGIDVSRWQDPVDWRSVRAAGTSFAFVKATEGGDHLSETFADQWRGSGAAGIPRGAYHVYYFCTPAAEQARWFIRNVPREAGALPPVLDLEWNPTSPTCRLRPDPATVSREVATFARMVAGHFGQPPILYMTPDFHDHLAGVRLSGGDYWLRSVSAHPNDRYPGTRWAFWQYSGTGRVPGVPGAVDLNAFYGSPEDWAVWRATRST